MATPIIMPRQGQSVESCIIGKWHKAAGDPVAKGDLLFTYETDKAVFDEASSVDGTLLARFFEEGDDVPCLTVVCVVGAPGEETAAYDPRAAAAAAAVAALAVPAPVAEAPAGAAAVESAPASVPAGAVAVSAAASAVPLAASPRARSLASRLGVSLAGGIAGTGPAGRVIERDVRAAVDAGQAATPAAAAMLADAQLTAGPGTGLGGRVRAQDVFAMADKPTTSDLPEETIDRPHTKIRKTIGTTMAASLGTMAQLTLNASFDATELLSLRDRLKDARDSGQAEAYALPFAQRIPTVTDFILYAVSRVLKRHPLLNAHGFDDHVRLFGAVHLGVAVDTPRGLMVPTLFHADRMSVAEISDNARILAESCRGGAIDPDLLRGGTFTVTNLGGLGIESFTPVINPPQTAILGVCAPSTRLRPVDRNGTGMPVSPAYTAIPLSLTFDHRAMDGADAARFLQELSLVLSNITAYMVG